MKKHLLSIFALLLMAVTGAMAQTETLLTTITATAKEQASYSTENVATVSFSYTAGGSSAYIANWGWWGYGWSATVNSAEGYTITKCVFYDDQNRTATDSEAPFVVETTEEDKTPKVNGTPIKADQSKGIKKIDVYGYVTPTTVDVTANEGATNEYWATFFSNASNYQASAGTQVFKVKLTGSAIEMTEITDRIVKSGQGVVLKNTSASITMTPTASNSSDDYSGNSLTGTMTNITNPGNAYVLNYKAETGAGFYKLAAAGTIGANKAYLTYGGALAREFFLFDGVTGIGDVQGAEFKAQGSDAVWYTIDGQKLNGKPTAKGVYLVNGKAVVIN